MGVGIGVAVGVGVNAGEGVGVDVGDGVAVGVGAGVGVAVGAGVGLDSPQPAPVPGSQPQAAQANITATVVNRRVFHIIHALSWLGLTGAEMQRRRLIAGFQAGPAGFVMTFDFSQIGFKFAPRQAGFVGIDDGIGAYLGRQQFHGLEVRG